MVTVPPTLEGRGLGGCHGSPYSSPATVLRGVGGNTDKISLGLLNGRAKTRAPEAAPWRWWGRRRAWCPLNGETGSNLAAAGMSGVEAREAAVRKAVEVGDPESPEALVCRPGLLCSAPLGAGGVSGSLVSSPFTTFRKRVDVSSPCVIKVRELTLSSPLGKLRGGCVL